MTLSCKCVRMLAQAGELPQQETWSDAQFTLEQHSNLIASMGLKGKVITLSACGKVCMCATDMCKAKTSFSFFRNKRTGCNICTGRSC